MKMQMYTYCIAPFENARRSCIGIHTTAAKTGKKLGAVQQFCVFIQPSRRYLPQLATN
jgi:hypothetical protein